MPAPLPYRSTTMSRERGREGEGGGGRRHRRGKNAAAPELRAFARRKSVVSAASTGPANDRESAETRPKRVGAYGAGGGCRMRNMLCANDPLVKGTSSHKIHIKA